MEVMSRSRLRIEPLTAEVGAEVRDADLETLDDESLERIRLAFFERTMLVIRRPSALGPDAQLAFTRRWGEVYITPYVKKLDGYPEILPVVNWGKAKTVTEAWHSDATF